MTSPTPPPPAAAGRESHHGPRQPLWRCLEEFSATDEFQQLLAHEFPGLLLPTADAVTRRSFLTAMGASLALASFTGCGRPPREEIVPRVEEMAAELSGRPLYFATAMTVGGYATGLLVEQQQGRPLKIEGNPDHPASLGATDIYAQASLLTFYDPDRSPSVRYGEQRSTWAAASAALEGAVAGLRSRAGAGLYLLSEASSSPTLARQLERLQTELPEARLLTYEPLRDDARYSAARAAFGRALDTVYRVERAELIVSLDADFLASGPGHLRSVREFASARRVWQSSPSAASMNRLYAVSPTPTLTWAAADQRLTLPARDIVTFARALAERLGVPRTGVPSAIQDERAQAAVAPLAADLRRRAGRCLILAGEHQPAEVHVLVHAINEALGNIGATVEFIPPVLTNTDSSAESLSRLARDMEAEQVQALVILGGNPAYTAPADIPFAALLPRIPFSLHLSLYFDETSQGCQWHIPEAHFLESWGDARAFDGTATLMQPLIEPLYAGRSTLELVARLRGQAEATSHALLREYWQEEWAVDDTAFAERWHRALHDGVIAESQFTPVAVELSDEWPAAITEPLQRPRQEDTPREILFRPDPTVYDGRFANNAWLQELPKPLSKVTWENVAVFGPRTAAALGLEQHLGKQGGDMIVDVVRIVYRDRTLEAPAWIMPGQAEDSITVYLGYGRSAGQVAQGRGYNGYRLRTSDAPWFGEGVTVTKTGRQQPLATTQLHHWMRGRDLVHTGTFEQYQQNPATIIAPSEKADAPQRSTLPVLGEVPAGATAGATTPAPPSLYPEFAYERHRWGMVIDLNACIGCSACVVACQAENNIPVVGREEVLRGREMHWLRVDVYHAGPTAVPEATYFQPVPCMHCEKAPCEVVCPVNATVHSDEGLNDMSYARCVGTRYCSNNCPYKVRRFNYLSYADWNGESFKALRNPDVTVRSRGIMEKCTYCVQRINRARMHAELDDRPLVQNAAGTWLKPILEGELLTACQAACPTQAIVFGDLNDPESQVARMRYEQPLNYGLLSELGTQPRTTYLAALRNPPSPREAHP